MVDVRALRAKHLENRKRRDVTAISLEASQFIVGLLDAERPTDILELGAGFSTWVLLSWANENPPCSLTSVDTEEVWLYEASREIMALGLTGASFYTWAEFLKEQPDLWECASFDVIFIDHNGASKRHEAIPLVAPLLREGGVMIFDDWQFPQLSETATPALEAEGFNVDAQLDTLDAHGRYIATARR